MPKYLLRQPKELEHLAILKTGEWITFQAKSLREYLLVNQLEESKAKTFLAVYIDVVRSYVEANVPRTIHNKITAEALRLIHEIYTSLSWIVGRRVGCIVVSDWWDRIEMITTTEIIETLFTKNLTSLSLSWENILLNDSIRSKSDILTGLVDLKIDAGANVIATIHFLKGLPGLKYLEVINCTDDILVCITNNCKLIEKLDLSVSSARKSLKFSSIQSLALLHNLKEVRLNTLSFDYSTINGGYLEVMSYILFSCENIECIDLGRVNMSLEEIYKHHPFAAKHLKLKSFFGMDNTAEQLQLVVKTCPLIERMSLVNISKSADTQEALIGLQNVRELNLENADFYEDVKNILQTIGRKLVHLQLDRVYNIDLNAIMDISQMCPYLDSLSLNFFSPIVHTPVLKRKLEIPPFRNLKKMNLCSMELRYSSRSTSNLDEQLLFLFSNCLNVEYIAILDLITVKEELMLNALKINSFIYLKQLRLYPRNTMVGKLFVDHIVQNGNSFPEVRVVSYDPHIE